MCSSWVTRRGVKYRRKPPHIALYLARTHVMRELHIFKKIVNSDGLNRKFGSDVQIKGKIGHTD